MFESWIWIGAWPAGAEGGGEGTARWGRRPLERESKAKIQILRKIKKMQILCESYTINQYSDTINQYSDIIAKAMLETNAIVLDNVQSQN